MEDETADNYNPRYLPESTARIFFNDRTPYSEQGRESTISILQASSEQPSESIFEPEDAIELADHPRPQSEFLNAQSDVFPASSRSKLIPGIIDRLGLQIIISNIIAGILLVLAVSVLSFLWFGGGKNKHWRQVMVDGWVGQAVTLSTLEIRFAVSVEASTAVAMLASVSLESKTLGRILLPEAPALSIARYVNTGPLGSLLYFWKSSRWRFSFSTMSISVLAATTIVSQFTSTLLLWDVRPSVVPGFPKEIKTGIGFSMEHYFNDAFSLTMSRAQNYWLASPPDYPSFAEWALDPLTSRESIMDTGPSIRAFLPIASESDRSSLLKFQGMASAFDARVTCVRPTIQDWSIKVSSNTTFKGTLLPPNVTEDLAEVLRQNIPPAGYSFDISIHDMFVYTDDPAFMVHVLPRQVGGLMNSLDPMQNSTLDYDYRATEGRWLVQNKENGESWEVELGHTFLIISTDPRGPVPYFGKWSLDLPRNEVTKNLKVEERGPWLDFTKDSDSGVMSITMCYDALQHNRGSRVKRLQDFLVSAERKSDYNEPKLGWDPKNGMFETSKIRAQLDTTSNSGFSAFALDPTYLNKILRSFRWSPKDYYHLSGSGSGITWYYDQGTYHLTDTLDIFKEKDAPSDTYDFLNDMLWRPFSKDVRRTFEIYVICHNCSKSTGEEAEGLVGTDLNPILNTMFADIMKETGNPALAWQSLVTTVMRMAYYDWLPTFDYMGNATVTSMVPCQKPQRRKGFLLVMANLLIHLVIVAASSFLFFTRTRYSLLSNAWQAIAQIKAPETELYLDNATMLVDKKVKQEISRKWIRRRFNIRRSDEDDRVCIS